MSPATNDYVRLFVAIVPPESVLAELSAAIGSMREADSGSAETAVAGPKLRWSTSESWHLTLAFLGQVDERVLPDLSTRLERAAHRYPALHLAIAGAGAFPRPTRARVLWAGIRADDAASLAALADSVAAGARRAGAPPPDEHRKYSPHLTLARSRDQADVTELTSALADFESSAWTAKTISLIRSNLNSRPRYAELGTWPLGAG